MPAAVRPLLGTLAGIVDEAADRIRRGGRVHYFGAGSSGRIAVLDAAELIPTFGLAPGVVIAHLAGGDGAMNRAGRGRRRTTTRWAGADAAGVTGRGRRHRGDGQRPDAVRRRRAGRRVRLRRVHRAGDVQSRRAAAAAGPGRAGRRDRPGSHRGLHPAEGDLGAEAHPEQLLDRADDPARQDLLQPDGRGQGGQQQAAQPDAADPERRLRRERGGLRGRAGPGGRRPAGGHGHAARRRARAGRAAGAHRG